MILLYKNQEIDWTGEPVLSSLLQSDSKFSAINFTVLVNGKIVESGDFDKVVLKEGDKIFTVPYLAGG